MKWLRRILFAAALLLIAVTTDWRQFVQVIRKVDLPLVAAAFIFLLAIDLLRAYKMALLSSGSERMRERVAWCYRYNLASGYYALALPGAVFGGGVRWFYYRKAFGGNNAAWMIIIDNYTQFLSVFILFAPAAFLIIESIIPGCLAIGTLAAMGCVPLLLHRIRLSTLFPFRKPAWFHSAVQFIDGQLSAFRTGIARSFLLIAVSLVYQCLITVFVWLLTIAAGVQIGWGVLVFAITGLTVIQLIPAVMGGIGIREVSLSGMLLPFGVHKEEAVVLGLLISLITIARGLAGAPVVFTLNRKA